MKYEMRPNKKMEKLHQCGLVEAVRRFMLKPHALFIEGSDAISRQMCIVEPIWDLNFKLRIKPLAVCTSLATNQKKGL